MQRPWTWWEALLLVGRVEGSKKVAENQNYGSEPYIYDILSWLLAE